jgi:hypothetical protein
MPSCQSKMFYHREAFVLVGNFLKSTIRATKGVLQRAGKPPRWTTG